MLGLFLPRVYCTVSVYIRHVDLWAMSTNDRTNGGWRTNERNDAEEMNCRRIGQSCRSAWFFIWLISSRKLNVLHAHVTLTAHLLWEVASSMLGKASVFVWNWNDMAPTHPPSINSRCSAADDVKRQRARKHDSKLTRTKQECVPVFFLVGCYSPQALMFIFTSFAASY